MTMRMAMRHEIAAAGDVVVDLHGSDIDEDLRPSSYWTPTGL
jgi:hypothetical protein